ncbi:MAG: DUF6370 family protein [Ferruginibacter sp.]
MKLMMLLILSMAGLGLKAQTDTTLALVQHDKMQVVEVACGECKFGMKGKSCDLAVRINGKAYFVDGTNIDDHGDAHAKDGFCNAVRMANVQGEIVDGRFKATYFKLILEKKEKSSTEN